MVGKDSSECSRHESHLSVSDMSIARSSSLGRLLPWGDLSVLASGICKKWYEGQSDG